jgi:PPOX class probable F420-dependent enzyme
MTHPTLPRILRGMKPFSLLKPPHRPHEEGAHLEEERVLWLGTVDAAGRPHLVPTWFSWDGESMWIWSKPNAVKVRNVRHEPRVMLALGEAQQDFDVQLVEACAELPGRDGIPRELLERHLAKYRRELRRERISTRDYLATYSQPIRIRPTRYLPWHGRGTRWSHAAAESAWVTPAAAGASVLRLALR